MSNNARDQCGKCGATLLPGRRFCVACLAQIPGAARQPSGLVADIARQIPSTHRPDKTLVFVPERREARVDRTRRQRRAIIAATIGVLILTIAAVAFRRVHERKQTQARQQRREQMARRELNLYATSLDLFHADFGRYPSAQEGIAALVRRPSTLAGWRGPYLDGDYSVDPWGNEYVYRVFNDGAGYHLFSYGPEGETAGRVFLQVHVGPGAAGK